MELFAGPVGHLVRFIALLALGLGLYDSARLLGVTLGDASPLAIFGPNEFVLLAIFSFSRLFAAVGLWMKESWGAVLLVGSTGTELALYLLGNPDIEMDAAGFAVRAVLLLGMLLIVLLAARARLARVQD